MAKNLRWKVLTIVGVVALAIWSFYPPDQKVKLGLDLKGGVHLVLRVQTDDALRLETQTTADRLAEQLKTTAKVAVGGVTVNDATSFTVNGVPAEQDAAFRNALSEVEVNYDRSSGTGSYTFKLKPNSRPAARGHGQPGAPDHRAPGQRTRRRRADRRAPQRR